MSSKDTTVNEGSPSADQLEGYEKLRNVGKGAFGIAVLYRKICDDTLVVIKEINMIELTVAERQLALNEVQVLRILDHPNIISYYRSFEKDGMLFIEMEYANGGTLAQFLACQTQPMKEIEVVFMFQQIVSAIKYMHSFNILHRDLKTANVFLTKEKVIKVGDFGISKIITTLAQAQSVLGTPYYISPEMCEGKEYNEKSDIWALGCILYEMTCLQKTFDGTNLPALVNKIMKGQFKPVPLEYSANLRTLIHDLLQKEPQLRPSAAEILDSRLPRIINYHTKSENGDLSCERESLINLQSSFNRNGKAERSVLYELFFLESTTSLIPVPLPPKLKIKEIAVSSTHFIALTADLMVYSWGEGEKGQLGHGMTVPWSGTPQLVEALKDKNIRRVGAGDGFSVFASESGMLMTCGDGSLGCLGHGEWNNALRPKLLEKLLTVDITDVSCGSHHVCVLSADGIMYSWGSGRDGQLGLGDEENCCFPNVVPTPDRIVLRKVKCGDNATMAITSDGAIFACGLNNYNKLGLRYRKHIFWPVFEEVEKSLTMKRVNITEKVCDVSLGLDHTLVLTERSQVISMGRNVEGQLGVGDTKPRCTPTVVQSVSDKIAMMVRSGPTFSFISTVENEIYFWGTRYKRHSIPGMFTSDVLSNHKSETTVVLRGMLQKSLPDVRQQELILEPVDILALYASTQQIEKGETVGLAGLYTTENSIFVLVDTSVPLVRKKYLSNQNRTLIQESEFMEDSNTFGPVPNWIKAEMARTETTTFKNMLNNSN